MSAEIIVLFSGWGATFWSFKSLYNNTKYSSGIEIYICAKGGYFELKDSLGDEYECRVDNNYVHSLNKKLIKQDITNALIRLGLKHIDTYIIQDPDMFFNTKFVQTQTPEQQIRLFYDYIIDVFFYLETEVSQNNYPHCHKIDISY